MTKPLIYLASPYSHPNSSTRMFRAAEVARIAGALMMRGYCIYCPIAETVFIHQFAELSDTSWNFWATQDLPKLAKCEELWIAKIKGWDKSIGIKGEVKASIKAGKKIALVDPRYLKIAYKSNMEVLELFGAKTVDDLND